MQGPGKRHTFEMLDVIRGLAALIVAERHLAYYFFEKQLPGSYLAVDIFFVLSGFVLAHAYEPRFGNGLSWRQFAVLRIIRLYPLYLLGISLGLLNLWLGSAENLTASYLPLAALTAATFLPFFISADTLYPLDTPTWTLPFELLVNALHAKLAILLSDRRLNIVIVIFAILLIGTTWYFDTVDVGYRARNFVAAFPRVGFSYFLGVRLYRLWRTRTQRSITSAWVIMVGIISVMLVPVPLPYRQYYDLLAVLVFIPALIYHAASVVLGQRSKKLLLPLGTASYALYVLHVPFGLLCVTIAARMGIDLNKTNAPLGGIAVLSVLLVGALALNRYFDLPLRKWLTCRLRRFT